MQHIEQPRIAYFPVITSPLGYNQIAFLELCRTQGFLFPLEGVKVAVSASAKATAPTVVTLLSQLLALRAAGCAMATTVRTVDLGEVKATFSAALSQGSKDNALIIHCANEFQRVRDLERALRAVQAWVPSN